MQFIDGGVTAPKGFTANGMLCKIKESSTATGGTEYVWSNGVSSQTATFTVSGTGSMSGSGNSIPRIKC